MDEEDLHRFQKPALAVDVVLFTAQDNDLKVGLIKREDEPYFGKFALPGRFVRYNEKIEDTARHALKLKGGIDPGTVFIKQLYTFGQNLDRDTRIRTVSVVYYGLVKAEDIDFQSGNKFEWVSVYGMPEIAFDHKSIIEYAMKRLRRKILTSSFAYYVMPHEFTLTELQHVYEVILGGKLDKRNFRKKLKESGVLKEMGQKKTKGPFRPAQLYCFKELPEKMEP